jgi:predicted RNase H-like nuclease (RuvC/YqgF family)
MLLHPKCRFVLCYEGEGAGDGGTGNEGDKGAGGDGGNVFSQEQVNKFVAEEKRSWQTKYEKLEQSINSLNEDRSLTEQEKQKLNEEVENLRKSLRTKETNAEAERKKAEEQYKNELESTKESAKRWEQMFKQSTVQRSLLDAAVQGDAYEPSQIVTMLQPFTELKEEDGQFKTMISFQDVDEKTGEPIETLRNPLEAVSRMKELKKYQNLFNSGVVPGIGGSNSGVAEGDIDVSSLTQEQYRKLRRENPERLGLPPNRRRAAT